MIAAELHRRSGLPWIADFRDPMAQVGYPAEAKTWRCFKRIEEEAVRNAARCVFVTPGAARMYRERYPDANPLRFAVIENGYDEDTFVAAAARTVAREPLNPGCLTILHSGIVYPSERDPTWLFVALERLTRRDDRYRRVLRVRFRAAVHETLLRDLARQHGLRDMVEIQPPIPYRRALEEMLRADGLLIMQAANSNAQIPAKLYEYLRAGRPMLGLTDPAGDTWSTLRAAGVEHLAALDDVEAIETSLRRFLEAVERGTVTPPAADFVASASRGARTRELARLLDEVSTSGK
jgi:glycosyltransferase involved in cell wall biosynthesis